MGLRGVAVIVIAAAVAACQSGSSGGGGGAPAAGAALTIPQIEALLVGNSLQATTTEGRALCAFHSTETHTSNSMIVRGTGTDGVFRGFYRVEPFTGASDEADPGLICYSYPDAGVFADCRSVRQSGSTAPGVTSVALYDREGTLRATGTVQPGDACGAAQ